MPVSQRGLTSYAGLSLIITVGKRDICGIANLLVIVELL